MKEIWLITLDKELSAEERVSGVQHKILGFGSQGYRNKGYNEDRILLPEDYNVSDFEEVIPGYRNIIGEEEAEGTGEEDNKG